MAQPFLSMRCKIRKPSLPISLRCMMTCIRHATFPSTYCLSSFIFASPTSDFLWIIPLFLSHSLKGNDFFISVPFLSLEYRSSNSTFPTLLSNPMINGALPPASRIKWCETNWRMNEQTAAADASESSRRLFFGDSKICYTDSCEFFLICWLTGGLIQKSCGGFLFACCHRPGVSQPPPTPYADSLEHPDISYGPVRSDART